MLSWLIFASTKTQSQKKTGVLQRSSHLQNFLYPPGSYKLGNENVFPAVHACLPCLYLCMVLNNTSISHIEVAVPWRLEQTYHVS